MYYTYVIYDDTAGFYYIGYTSDIHSRLNEHTNNKVKTTKKLKNKILVYYEACVSKKRCRKKRKRVKNWFWQRIY